MPLLSSKVQTAMYLSHPSYSLIHCIVTTIFSLPYLLPFPVTRYLHTFCLLSVYIVVILSTVFPNISLPGARNSCFILRSKPYPFPYLGSLNNLASSTIKTEESLPYTFHPLHFCNFQTSATSLQNYTWDIQ
jgi:hypothetical protein